MFVKAWLSISKTEIKPRTVVHNITASKLLLKSKKMKTILMLLLSLFIISCDKELTKNKVNDNFTFTESQREKYLQNREDSTTWDKNLFKFDLDDVNSEKSEPFTYGVFPVPEYNLIGKGTFIGLGNYAYTGSGEYVKNIKDKSILFNSFFVKKSELNKNRLKDKKDEIFFQIIVLTDTIDSTNFTHFQSQIISRNHPDYIGQGIFRTKNNIIEYVAFLTAEQNSYAIVDTRLFDLKFGKTILIAPQKDKSLRTMQIKSPFLSSEEINNYTDSLLIKNEVIDFFTKQGNI